MDSAEYGVLPVFALSQESSTKVCAASATVDRKAKSLSPFAKHRQNKNSHIIRAYVKNEGSV